MSQSIVATFVSYERELQGSTYKYTFDITLEDSGTVSIVKIVRFGSSRNECMKKAFAQLREDLSTLAEINGATVSMASKVTCATPLPSGAKLKIFYQCEELDDNFTLMIPFSMPLKQDELTDMQRLTKDLQEQQREYLTLHPDHGFKELFGQ